MIYGANKNSVSAVSGRHWRNTKETLKVLILFSCCYNLPHLRNAICTVLHVDISIRISFFSRLIPILQ